MLPSRIFSQVFSPEMPPRWMMPSHPGDHALDRRHVGDVGLVDLLAVARRGERHPVGQAQHRIDAAQRLAQRSADAAAGAGDQHAMHLRPPSLSQVPPRSAES